METKLQVDEKIVQALRELQHLIYKSNVKAGWYTDLETGDYKERDFGVAIALMHTELSEAYEGHRKCLPDDHLPDRDMREVELADAVIRILDTAGAEGMDLAGALRDKFAYNQTRADHTIKHRRMPGGKKT